MNYFTETSIELANQRNYLDQLFSVYPLNPDSIREINPTLWNDIKQAFSNNDNTHLFLSLLKLKLFPIKDGYVPFFRLSPNAIKNNPETVNRICGRVKELGLDKLYEKCTQPKETNRQMGPLFRKWLEKGTLGVIPVQEVEFLQTNGFAILSGSDASLADFARRHLGYTRDKGLDFIAKRNNHYFIGEAKFISDEGGHQNDQFLDAITTLSTPTFPNVIKVAILDGVLYINSKKKMYRKITSGNFNIMSALLLRDFVYSIQ
ncbi:restriction endonuclease [Candidatus Avelusimicrobium fimicolum]|uniref:restriction endonuclease n=1 Tax=Candidatus Avelusimicrobium fimicolum TaxID=3416216 RepID=UPI003D0F1C7C